jgi:membrane associated rhomboid family serine protease
MLEENGSVRRFGREVKFALKIVLGLVALMWLAEVVDRVVFQRGLDQFGIVPRQLAGLWGILVAPFLHASFAHLLANTLPLIVLGTLVMLSYPRRFLAISAIIVLVSGLGTWLIAPPQTIHIGASGLIFGYLAFLLAAAWHERSFGSIGLAAIVVVLYGGILWGVLPQDGPVSWQGHLFGVVGGLIAAHLFSRRRPVITLAD